VNSHSDEIAALAVFPCAYLNNAILGLLMAVVVFMGDCATGKSDSEIQLLNFIENKPVENWISTDFCNRNKPK